MNDAILRLVAILSVVGWCGGAHAQGLEPLSPLPGDEQPKPDAEAGKAEAAKPDAEPDEPEAAKEPESSKPDAEHAEPAESEAAEPAPPAEEIESLEETVTAGRLAILGTAGDPSVPPAAREALDGAVAALVAADHDTARELLTQVRAALPEEHWLLPTVARLDQLADVVERGVVRGGSVEDESVASLYVTLTLYGFYSGVWLFGILGEIDVQATVPLSVATAGIGLGVAYLLDHRDEPLSGAMADGISSGITLGAAEAILLLAAISPDDLSEKAWFSLIWGSSLVGSVIGGYAVRASGASRGDVALATAGYTWGAVIGLTMAAMFAVDDFDNVMKVVLVGATAGFGGGIALASQVEMSASRVLYINLGGLAGALVGVGIAVGGSFDSIEPVGATLAVTYIGGLAIAAYLTRDLDLPELPLALNTAPTLIPSVDPTRAPAPGVALQLTW